MKRTALAAALAAIIYALSFPAGSRAEMVAHHGEAADSDGDAAYCVSCHDGTIAKGVSICTVDCRFDTAHRISADYPPAGKEASFAPADAVREAGVKLVNGQVTCGSCHNLKNQGKYHLAVETARSKLCITCHIR